MISHLGILHDTIYHVSNTGIGIVMNYVCLVMRGSFFQKNTSLDESLIKITFKKSNLSHYVDCV